MAANFQKATITQTFTASLPQFESERGGLLELAKVTAYGIVQKSARVAATFAVELSAGNDDYRDSCAGDVPLSPACAMWRLDVENGSALFAPKFAASRLQFIPINGKIIRRGLGAIQRRGADG